MDGDIAPLPELVEIANKYNCTLIIDEAHATGVIGKTGKGTVEYYKDKTGIDLTESVDLQIGTLSKALASEGGFVCGKKVYIDYLINKSRPFIFSTALSPATIASANAALNLLKENSEEYLNNLNENTRLMRKLLCDAGWRNTNHTNHHRPSRFSKQNLKRIGKRGNSSIRYQTTISS